TGQETRTFATGTVRIESSGRGSTVVRLVVKLLARFGSCESLATLTRLVIVPVACGFTVRVTLTEVLLVSVPTLATTLFPLVTSVPCVVRLPTRLTEPGRKLVITRLGAEKGPRFWTTIV